MSPKKFINDGRKLTGNRKNKRKKKRIPRNLVSINPQKSKNKLPDVKGKDVSIRQSDAPWGVLYGRSRIGGVQTFAYDNQSQLNLVITLACHEINQITSLYLNEDKIVFGDTPDPRWATGGIKPDGSTTTSYNEKVFMALNSGAEDQTAQGDLVTQSAALFPGKWTSDHRQRGLAHVYIILVFNNQAFPDGLPDISFEVEGKPVYDPRTDTTVYSNNAALVIADYLMDTKFGLGVPSTRIDMDRLSDAADTCDEAVPLLAGGTEARYTIDLSFDTDETKGSILEKMATAIGGYITYTGGKWKIWPAEYQAPSITLDESDLRSDVKIKTRVSRRDNFNAVRGTYTSPANKWQVTDFPIVTNSFYQTQDNGERVFQELKFPCALSAPMCQRLAKIELERIRQPIVVSASFGLRAFNLEVPNTVALTLERYGWVEKVFEVVESELVLEDSRDAPELRVDLQLREIASGVFDWNSGQETSTDLAPNTTLPSPFDTPALTGLTLLSGTDQLYIRADGTVFSRIRVEWDSFEDTFTNSNGTIEIQYKNSYTLEWIPSTPVNAELDFAFILDVQDGVFYDVRARARNPLGVFGEWDTVTWHLVVGKTEPPSDVSYFSGTLEDYGIRFYWTPITDLDVSHYEIRLADEALDWDTAAFIAEVAGDQYVLRMQVNAVYRFMIKAVDTSGNYSLNAAQLNVAVQKPTAVTIQHEIVGENVRLKWTESTAHFAIEEYEVRYGTSFDLSVFVAKIKSTALNIKGAWTGTRRFWVVAYDVAGNQGETAFRDVTIYAPFAVSSLTAQIVDNNVLLRWSASTGGTLPVAYYQVRKGDLLESSELIGNTSGTFSAVFEILAGTYIYWVVPVDTAGNVGQAVSIPAVVDQPPDFELLADVILDPEDATTLDNIRLETRLEAPVIVPEPPLEGESRRGELMGLFMPLTYAN